MKFINRLLVFLLANMLSLFTYAQKETLWLAPGSLSAEEATVLWKKEEGIRTAAYEIYLNGKTVDSSTRTNYSFTHLQPGKQYTVGIKRKGSKQLTSVEFKTPKKGDRFNILDYGARTDAQFDNTAAIQAAINACTSGGTVVIPKGEYVSGALFLKSNMTFLIEEGGILKGSTDTARYLPLIYNRFEGWEMPTYASLLNAGSLNRNGGYNVRNLRICGKGTISGGGRRLGDAMIRSRGMRGRGRLILLMNCQDVAISGLTITEPPCWTIHYIYSNRITCSNLNIITNGIRNGDGIDPDSSTDSYIFNCSFDTGDDCIAIKSGKNPEGYFVAKPTKQVRITDCLFRRGHGISIGSEMSGGVSEVLVQDCKAGALLHGMQIKGTKDRGGYIRNVTVRDCELLKITVFTSLNYNNDGEAAPVIPQFSDFHFINIDLTGAKPGETVIQLNGFREEGHRLKNLSFSNITLPDDGRIEINDAENLIFSGVRTKSGAKPFYSINRSSEILN